MVYFLRVIGCLLLCLLLASLAAVGLSRPLPAAPKLLYETGGGFFTDVALLDVRTHVSLPLTERLTRNVSPTWAPNGSAVTFASSRNGRNADLYQIELPSRQHKLLQETPEQGVDLVWSPVGDRAVFLEGSGTYFNLYLYEQDTIRAVTRNGMVSSPVWSPDGSQLVFIDSHQNMPDLFWIPSGSFQPRRLTRNAAVASVIWTPDGNHLLYTTRPTPNSPRFVEIRHMSTGDTRPLITLADNTWQVALSPSGEQVAYVAGVDTQNLYIADFDMNGGFLNRRLLMPDMAIEDLRWSDDGQWIVFSGSFLAARERFAAFLERPAHQSDLRYGLVWVAHKWFYNDEPFDIRTNELYVYRMGWATPRRVTSNTGHDARASWQPSQ